MRRYVTEVIGTFFLVATVGFVIKGGKTDEPFVLAPLAIGSSLMIKVYMGGHISGGHYNPAVSLAVWLRGKLTARDLISYWVAQLVGAILASIIVYLVLGKTFAPVPSVNAGRAMLVEFLFTFALALVVLNTMTLAKTDGNSYYGLAIGFTVMVGAVAVGGLSGGAFNPAVGVGPTLIHASLGNGSLLPLWIYIVGPLAGGAAAAGVFKFQIEPRDR
jgi:aquaporin Z